MLMSVAFGSAALPSCSDSSFRSDTGVPQRPIDGNPSPLESGNNPNPFAKAGKSLDLYFIMDKSGSLYVDPVTQKQNSGSDVECKRFDALQALLNSLRGKLKSGEQVRMTIVTFSRRGSQLGTLDDVLNQSQEQIRDKFRAGICDNPDFQTTNYERGISLTLQSFETNTASKKLDLQSVVFFSDGAAKDTNTDMLEQSISRLNTAFPQRIYGVLLGNTLDKCVLRDSNGRNLQTQECMLKVVGNDSQRLLNVDNAQGLASAWADLVNR